MRLVMANSHAKFAHQPPEITILSDHAAQDRSPEQLEKSDVAVKADRDLLALQSRLSSTFDILRHKNTRCPLAIAVYGGWGTGKTSAMHWLETKLKDWNSSDNKNRGIHPRAYPVWFDPWRYDSRDEVWRGIIAEVILALFDIANLNRYNFLPRLVQAAKKFGGFLGRSFLHTLANIELKAGSDILGAEGSLSGEAFREVWEEYDKTANPQKAYLNQFEDVLRSWVSGFLKELGGSGESRPRLVIFIDDLDRCLPDVALEVIEALKLYLNIDSLIFVVGLDETVVKEVVNAYYKKNGVSTDKAASYLNKLFQVDVHIQPSEAQMSGFMRDLLETLNTATDNYWEKMLRAHAHYKSILEGALIRLAHHNPREMKRLLNSALTLGRNAAADDNLNKKSNETTKRAALRFAQGIQVVLLQRMLLNYDIDINEVLITGPNLDWFVKTSELVREFMDRPNQDIVTLVQRLHEVRSKEGAVELHAPFASGSTTEEALPSAEKELQQLIVDLHKHLTENPPDKDRRALWMHREFLELMRVEFSRAVAQSVPVMPPSSPLMAAIPLSLGAIPHSILQGLAAAVGVQPDHLTLELLPRITKLDFMGAKLTSDELGKLPQLENLEELSLAECSALETLPEWLGLEKLRLLDLRGCTGLKDAKAFKNIGRLGNLEFLYLWGCTELKEVPDLSRLEKLKKLSLRDCKQVRGTEAFKNIANLESLEELFLYGCTGLDKVPDWRELIKLKVLELRYCTGLKGGDSFENIVGLSNLEQLYLSGCTGLEKVPDWSGMIRLKVLRLSLCTGLKEPDAFHNIASFKELEEIYLWECTGLSVMPDLSKLPKLRVLNLGRCKGLKATGAFGILAKLKVLEMLSLNECSGLEELPELGGLQDLRELHLTECIGLKALPNDLSMLTKLRMLDLSGCISLTGASAFAPLSGPGALTPEFSEQIESSDFDSFGLAALEVLDLSNCTGLETLPKMSHSQSMRVLWLSGCKNLRCAKNLTSLKGLQVLNLSYCNGLEVLPDMRELKKLQEIDLRGCAKLKGVADLKQQLPKCKIIES